MSQRGRILERLRRAPGANAGSFGEALAARCQRLGKEPSPRPVWEGDRIARFLERFEAAAGTWERITSADAIPGRADHYLGQRGASQVRIARHPWIEKLDWQKTDLEVRTGIGGSRNWPAAMTVATAGIAETGTLVFPASPEAPTSLNFLPDYALVVLHSNAVVDYMEAVWPLLEARLPRTVNLITGPSRTADVEQTIQLGAHGPRQLHLLLLDG